MWVHPTADIDQSAFVHSTASVWHYAQIRGGAHVGSGTVIGRGAYVGQGVPIGSNCKIQNYALVYEPAELADGVFIGPAAVLTNDHTPRAVNPDGKLKAPHDWRPVGVRISEGASIGARAVCVAPLQIGRWAMVAAGAVVVRDVPDFALVAGVPARQIGWVGRAGQRLIESAADGNVWNCPQTNESFRLSPEGVMFDA